MASSSSLKRTAPSALLAILCDEPEAAAFEAPVAADPVRLLSADAARAQSRVEP